MQIKMSSSIGVVVAMIFLISTSALAEEIKYKPVNPNFGGNPFNGPALLSNATAQRQHDPPERRKDPMEEFSDTIKKTLLNQISREIADQIMGEDAKQSGQFNIGELMIDFQQVGGQVVIDINDEGSGGQTTIEIPMPSY